MSKKKLKKRFNASKILSKVRLYPRPAKIRFSIKKLYEASVVMLAVLASAFTIFTGILAFQNIDSFNEWFNKEFQTKQYWLNAANSLAPEVNVSLFDKKLGQPIFTSTIDKLTNRTYVNDYFYTQVITSDSGSVLMYSITLRQTDFYPNIPYFEQGPEKDRRYLLGKTTFGDMSGGEDKEIVAGQYLPSFRRGIYSEGYYFGNPGNYLYYFLSINDAGIGGGGYAKLDNSVAKAYNFNDTGLFDDCTREFLPSPGNMNSKTGDAMDSMKEARRLMNNEIANTITVTNRHGSAICANKDFFKEMGIMILGPDLDKVRLLRQ